MNDKRRDKLYLSPSRLQLICRFFYLTLINMFIIFILYNKSDWSINNIIRGNDNEYNKARGFHLFIVSSLLSVNYMVRSFTFSFIVIKRTL